MSGSHESAIKARDKLLAKDPDYFKKLSIKAAEARRRNKSKTGYASPNVGKDGMTGKERAKYHAKIRNNVDALPQ